MNTWAESDRSARLLNKNPPISSAKKMIAVRRMASLNLPLSSMSMWVFVIKQSKVFSQESGENKLPQFCMISRMNNSIHSKIPQTQLLANKLKKYSTIYINSRIFYLTFINSDDIFVAYFYYSEDLMEQKKNESRHERFKRIASKRTNDIFEKIRILGNCSNKSSYEYTEEEVNKIFSELDKQLKLTKAKFLAGKRERFRL